MITLQTLSDKELYERTERSKNYRERAEKQYYTASFAYICTSTRTIH